VGGDLDAALNPFVEHERVAMKRRELWGEEVVPSLVEL
jgi:hypothetical protein